MSHKIAWLIQVLVPYHHERFNAAVSLGEFSGHLIQVTNVDTFKPLEFVPENAKYTLHTLFPGIPRSQVRSTILKDKLFQCLDHIAPECVCVSGWGMEIGNAMQAWALKKGVPIILFSESTEFDSKRNFVKELLKSIIIKSCDAYLVGGVPHAEYVRKLGAPENRVFLGHNAVSSDHFEKEAKIPSSGIPLQLTGKTWFFACARFGKKKNFPRLIRAFNNFAKNSKDQWFLAIAGDGEERKVIEQTIKDCGAESIVILLGPLSYNDLPWYYQNCVAFIHSSTTEQWGLVVNEAMAAGAPILVSNRTGCAYDLVKEGENGFHFDPYSEENISSVMRDFSKLNDLDCSKMKDKSKDIISQWGLESFASNLTKAFNAAVSEKKSKSLLKKSLASVVIWLCQRYNS